MFTTVFNDLVVREWLQKQPSGYRQWLLELRDAEIKTLKTSENEVSLHRAQGRLELLDRLIGLENELREVKKGAN